MYSRVSQRGTRSSRSGRNVPTGGGLGQGLGAGTPLRPQEKKVRSGGGFHSVRLRFETAWTVASTIVTNSLEPGVRGRWKQVICKVEKRRWLETLYGSMYRVQGTPWL